MKVALPESLRDYMNEKVVQSVVDRLLEVPDTNLPVDEWDEVPAYYKAWLSAQKVKTDYALFLFDLWDAIWKPALQEAGLNNELSIDEAKKQWKTHRPTRENIWVAGLNRLFWTNYKKRKVLLHTFVGDDGGNGITIQAVLYNADDEEITEQLLLSLSKHWQKALENGFCMVNEDLCPALDIDNTELDVSSLRLAAQELLKNFKPLKENI